MEEKDQKQNKNPLGADGKDFGHIIDTLHNKSALPSLRTYQGDTAEFIRSKSESVVSIAAKEKMRDDDRKEEAKKPENKIKYAEVEETKEKPKSSNFNINITMLALSFLLIGGGIVGAYYIFNMLASPPLQQIEMGDEIIPYNNIITLANLSNTNLGSELEKISGANGISLVKISDTSGKPVTTTKDLINFLKVSLPASLNRTLEDKFALGVISVNGQVSSFLVLKVNDFGQAFAAMLDWEDNVKNDLSFLNYSKNITATSTQSTLVWKDIIVKNKDTRALATNGKNQAMIAYAFLDKNTVLIVNNISAIGDITSTYASRAVAR